MRLRIVAVPVMTMLLAACATGFHSAANPILGLTGGYWSQKGPGQLVKVGFIGNIHTDYATVSDYILFRCAQLAKVQSMPYFLMYESLPDAVIGKTVAKPTVGSIANSNADYVYMLATEKNEPGAQSTDAVLKKYAQIVNWGTK